MKWPTIIPVAMCLGLTALSASAKPPAQNVAAEAGLPARSAPAEASKNWLTDFEKAKKEAAETQRPILADFSGSDWSAWCIRLDKEVFSQEAFKAFAKDNLVLFVADFPRKKEQPAELKKQNEALNTTYAIRNAFPTVLLLDATGKELARTGYRKGGAEAYVEHLKSLLKEQKQATPK